MQYDNLVTLCSLQSLSHLDYAVCRIQSLKYYAEVLILNIIQYGMMSMNVDFVGINSLIRLNLLVYVF